jgi:hypothetical protein
MRTYILRNVIDNVYRVFNTGSPHNAVAGQGPINLENVIAHYEKQNAEEDERRAKIKALAAEALSK